MITKHFSNAVVVNHKHDAINLYNETFEHIDPKAPFLNKKIVQIYKINWTENYQIALYLECSHCKKRIYFFKYLRLKRFCYKHPRVGIKYFEPKVPILFKLVPIKEKKNGNN